MFPTARSDSGEEIALCEGIEVVYSYRAVLVNGNEMLDHHSSFTILGQPSRISSLQNVIERSAEIGDGFLSCT